MDLEKASRFKRYVMFFIANRSITARISSDLPCSRVTIHAPSIFAFNSPHLFPYNRDENDNVASGVGNNRPIYLFCRENVINEIIKLDTSKLASLYAKFFQKLWKKGQHLRLGSRSMVYSRLTPPCLLKSVVFMYGPQRSCSLPFLLRTLPNKNKIREKNGKILEAAIMDVWMKKERSSGIILASILRSNSVNIPEEN